MVCTLPNRNPRRRNHNPTLTRLCTHLMCRRSPTSATHQRVRPCVGQEGHIVIDRVAQRRFWMEVMSSRRGVSGRRERLCINTHCCSALRGPVSQCYGTVHKAARGRTGRAAIYSGNLNCGLCTKSYVWYFGFCRFTCQVAHSCPKHLEPLCANVWLRVTAAPKASMHDETPSRRQDISLTRPNHQTEPFSSRASFLKCHVFLLLVKRSF